MTTVLFIIPSESMPSSRIRVYDLVPDLQAHGFSCDVSVLPKGIKARHHLFKRARNYSVVILQKKLLRWMDFTQLRHYAKRLVFDFDDAIYFRCASPSQNHQDYVSGTRRRLFNRTVNGVDRVITANTVLASAASKAAPNTPVDIIPSPIATEGVTPKSDYRLNTSPVIGWVGTSTNLRYLSVIESTLRQLQKEHGTILHVIADKPFVSKGLDCRFIPWSLDTQYNHLCECDIGVMPLSSDPFSEGKASFKLLQYLACGLPAVCSPVGMNVEVSDNDTNCLLAHSPEHFFEQLSRLLGNESLRSNLGQCGRKLISEQYTTQAVGKQLAESLRRITNNDV